MEGWRAWRSFRHSVIFRAKCMLLKVTSRLRPTANGNEKGLLRLYKDMEDCRGYQDIQVMWEMVHSSFPRDRYENSSNRRLFQGGFCFWST